MKSLLIVVCVSLVVTIADAKPTHFIVSSIPTIYNPSNINQFHTQNYLGQYTYGYNSDLSTKTETRTMDGITRGTYSYIDAVGKLQTVEYTADPVNGFRAAVTNLPIAPIDTGIAPEPIKDTVEVIKARADHLIAFDEVAKRFDVESQAAATEEMVSAQSEGKSAQTVDTFIAPEPIMDTEEVIKARADHLAAFNEVASRIDVSAPSTEEKLVVQIQERALPTVVLPEPIKDTEEVIKARADHLAAFEEVSQRNEVSSAPTKQQLVEQIEERALPLTVVLPEPIKDTEEVIKARADHLAAFEEVSQRNEVSSAPTKQQLVEQIEERALPLTVVLPEPIKDTEEVIKARADHLAAYDEVARRISMATLNAEQMPQYEVRFRPVFSDLKNNEDNKEMKNVETVLPSRVQTFSSEEIPTTLSRMITAPSTGFTYSAPSVGFTYSTPWVDANQFGYVVSGVPFFERSVPHEVKLAPTVVEKN